MRYALYYTPQPGDPLLGAAEAWLGRSAFGQDVDRGASAAPALVTDARRYGFHATLKAPFALAEGRSEAQLHEALAAFAAAQAPVEDLRLRLAQPSGFFALVPDGPHTALDAFAAEVVQAFEPFRAPLSETDRARRRPETLPERQRAHLDRWGYPYVFADFAFHMTLTGRLDAEASEEVRPALEERFAPLLAKPRRIDALALFAEREPGADFEVAALRPLTGHPRTPAAFGHFDAA